jgi:hypothetical protein
MLASFCFAEDDSLNLLSEDTSQILNIHEVDLSSSLAKINDTTGFGLKKTSKDENKIINGKRDKSSILQIIMKNIAVLRYEYNKRLSEIEKENEGKNHKALLDGKLTVGFKIVSDGSVISCNAINSTLNDSLLELSVLLRIYKWNFGAIPINNDTTEMIYPFVFSK